jgi:hypothetical protein
MVFFAQMLLRIDLSPFPFSGSFELRVTQLQPLDQCGANLSQHT